MLKNSQEKIRPISPATETLSGIGRSARTAILMALLSACAGNDAPETLIFETRYQQSPCEKGYTYCIDKLDAPKGELCEGIKITLTDAEDTMANPVTASSKIYPDGKCKAIFKPGMKGFEEGPYEVEIATPTGYDSGDCDGGSAVQAIQVWAGDSEVKRDKHEEIQGREIVNCIIPE